MDRRIDELDSLRGLAALSVLFSHLMLTFPVIYNSTDFYECKRWLLKIIIFSPLHIIWDGHAAVIFFFILSGFVLALPFLKANEGIPYLSFLVKRIFRIYIPYFYAILIAIIMNCLFLKFFYRGNISELSIWFNSFWHQSINVTSVIQHFVMIGNFNANAFDFAIWSLVHEMRISIIFPLIMYFILKYDWKINLSISFLPGVLNFLLPRLNLHYIDHATSYFDTLGYIGIFMFGALLAKYRQFLIQKFLCLNKIFKYICLLTAILAYTNSYWLRLSGIPKGEFINEIFSSIIVKDWGISLGVSGFIIIALSSKKLSSILLRREINFFGKISYSMYLYHPICLLTLLNLLYGLIPIWLIILLFLISSIAISALGYYMIELPSIKLGKYLSSLMHRKRLSSSTDIGSI
jgi:Predicted acyltransferases